MRNLSPGSPNRKILPGVSGPESRPRIFARSTFSVIFKGRIFLDPADYFMAGAVGNRSGNSGIGESGRKIFRNHFDGNGGKGPIQKPAPPERFRIPASGTVGKYLPKNFHRPGFSLPGKGWAGLV